MHNITNCCDMYTENLLVVSNSKEITQQKSILTCIPREGPLITAFTVYYVLDIEQICNYYIPL